MCKENLKIDGGILQYTYISFEELSRSSLLPIQYKYKNTNPVLKKFFVFLINNVDEDYPILTEILIELSKVKIESFYMDGEKCYL